MLMTEKCNQKKDVFEYQRRSFEGLAPLTREIRIVTKPVLGKRGFAEIDILESWHDIVGEELARGIFPEKLTFDRDKRVQGTLHVKSAGGAFAMLFEHQKSRVIERINSFFGYPAVSHIKVMQGNLKLTRPVKKALSRTLTPVEEADLWRQVQNITDPELRQKTFEIGAELLLRNK